MRLLRCLASLALPLLLGLGVVADQTIVIDGADASIKYTTVNNGDSGATWTPVARSPDSCDTPQMLTSRLGDYVTFTFTGTAVQVVGTIGKKRGLIQFTFDGVNSTFDRSNTQLVCDSVIFQKSGLPFQQHTVMATLIGRAPNFSNGLEDGCISIQRIRYTIPGGSSSGSSKVGVAVGAAVGGVALVVACILLWIYIKRRNRLNNSGRRPNSLDGESLPPHLKDKTASPGIVATPFEWAGPGSQFYSRSDGHSTVVGNPPSVTHGLQPPNAPVTPSTMVSSHPTGSGMYPPGPRSTSSGSGGVNPAAGYSDAKQRESMMTGYGVSNPTENVPLSPRTGNLPDPAVGRRSTSGQGSDDVALVDRIAHRLADIMQTRSGGVGVMDQIVPPPVYTDPNAGRASSHSTSPPPTSSPSEYPSAVSPTQLPYAHPGSAQPPYLPYPGAPKY